MRTPPKLHSALSQTFSSLAIRNYRIYFAGQSLSLIGTWMQSIAQSWLVFTLTHSGVAVGGVVALQTLPILLFGPIGGTIADRFGKYRILFWTQSFAGFQALVLALLILGGHIHLWEIYAVAFALGIINMVDNPARQTFIIEMVGRDALPNAVTLNAVMVNVARAIGPAVAGVLIALVGTGWCFAINAFSYLFVIFALIALDKSKLTPTDRVTHMRGQLLEGFRYVAHFPLLRTALIMMGIIGCLTYEFQVSLPLIAGKTFHGSSITYGLLTSFMGGGSVIGGLLIAGRRSRNPKFIVEIAFLFGITVLLGAVAPVLWVEELVLIGIGACSVAFMSLGNSTLQLSSEPNMRGRVMSLWSVAFMGSSPIGAPIVGATANLLGARASLGLGGIAALIAAGYGWFAFRNIAHTDRMSQRVQESPIDPASEVEGALAGAVLEPLEVKSDPSSSSNG